MYLILVARSNLLTAHIFIRMQHATIQHPRNAEPEDLTAGRTFKSKWESSRCACEHVRVQMAMYAMQRMTQNPR